MIATAIETTSRPDLQKLCRERALAAGQPRTWIVSASMDTLRTYATGGELPAASVPVAGGGVNALADAIRSAATEAVAERLDAVEERLGKLTRATEVHIPGRPVVTITATTHSALADVLLTVQAGVPVLLVGPAGSGKTQLAAHVAEALGRTFTFNSMSGGVTESALLGAVNPMTGEYQPSLFARAYRDGGVHLLDEIDAADPNLLVQVNAAVSNGHLAIPRANLVIAKHPDFVLLAAANTYGTGPDAMYVGREQLDAATLDRFCVGRHIIGYDPELEQSIVDGILPTRTVSGAELLQWCWTVREAIEAHKLRRIMSTRTIANSARLLAVGRKLDAVKAAYLAGWSTDELRRVN